MVIVSVMVIVCIKFHRQGGLLRAESDGPMVWWVGLHLCLIGHAGSAERQVDLKTTWHYGRVEIIPPGVSLQAWEREW